MSYGRKYGSPWFIKRGEIVKLHFRELFSSRHLICLLAPTSFCLALFLASYDPKISICTTNWSTLANISIMEVGWENAKDSLSKAKVVPWSRADATRLTGRSFTSYVALWKWFMYCFNGLFSLCCRLIKYITFFFSRIWAMNALKNSSFNCSN